MHLFIKKLRKAQLSHVDYSTIFKKARSGDVIYCDPPYVSNHQTQPFKYYGNAFTTTDQQALADLANDAALRGIKTVISNHDTPFTREIYKGAKFVFTEVYRSINCKSGGRRNVKELLAIFA